MTSTVAGGPCPLARPAATASAAGCDQSARISPKSQAVFCRASLSTLRAAAGELVEPAFRPVRLVQEPQHPAVGRRMPGLLLRGQQPGGRLGDLGQNLTCPAFPAHLFLGGDGPLKVLGRPPPPLGDQRCRNASGNGYGVQQRCRAPGGSLSRGGQRLLQALLVGLPPLLGTLLAASPLLRRGLRRDHRSMPAVRIGVGDLVADALTAGRDIAALPLWQGRSVRDVLLPFMPGRASPPDGDLHLRRRLRRG